MEQRPRSIADIASEDWDSTPVSVKKLVESLLLQKAGEPDALLPKENLATQWLDALPIGVWVNNATGQLTYINQAGVDILGISSSGQTGAQPLTEPIQIYRSATQAYYPIDQLPLMHSLADQSATNDVEIHWLDRVIPLEVLTTTIDDPQGQTIYAIAVFQDITQRKQMEVEQQRVEHVLRQNESHYRRIVQTQSDFILRSRPDTTITFANKAFCRALGLPIEQVVEQRWIDFAHQEDLQNTLQRISTLTPEQPSFLSENRDRRADGQVGWTQWLNQGIFDPQGNLIEIQSVGRDITDLKQVENVLSAQEAWFSLFMDHSPAAAWVTDLQGQMEYVNQTYTQMFQVPKDPVGQTVFDLYPPNIAQAYLESIQATAASNQVLKGIESGIRVDGSLGEFMIYKFPLPRPDGRIVIGGIALDVTEQQAMLNERDLAEAAFRQQSEQIALISAIAQRIRQSLHLKQILTTTVIEIKQWLQVDRVIVYQFLPNWSGIVRAEAVAAEWTASLKAEIEDVCFQSADEDDHPQGKRRAIANIYEAGLTRCHVQLLERFEVKASLVVPILLTRKSEETQAELWGLLIAHQCSAPREWHSNQLDLLDQIAVQLAIAIQQAQAFEQAQTELVERQQAEADLRAALVEKEVLLKEIHHRVKNNLQIVSGLLQLQTQGLDDPKVVQALRESQNRIESMSLIHKKLYTSSDLGQIDVADYIQSLASNLLTSYQIFPATITLKTEIEPIVLSVDQAIPCGLIINELVSNALKYAFPQGEPGEIYIKLCQIGQNVVLTVQDNGVGLPKQLDWQSIQAIKSIQSLGISLVYALATDQLEGSLAVNCMRGTAFTIKFPIFTPKGQRLNGYN